MHNLFFRPGLLIASSIFYLECSTALSNLTAAEQKVHDAGELLKMTAVSAEKRLDAGLDKSSKSTTASTREDLISKVEDRHIKSRTPTLEGGPTWEDGSGPFDYLLARLDSSKWSERMLNGANTTTQGGEGGASTTTQGGAATTAIATNASTTTIATTQGGASATTEGGTTMKGGTTTSDASNPSTVGSDSTTGPSNEVSTTAGPTTTQGGAGTNTIATSNTTATIATMQGGTSTTAAGGTGASTDTTTTENTTNTQPVANEAAKGRSMMAVYISVVLMRHLHLQF